MLAGPLLYAGLLFYLGIAYSGGIPWADVQGVSSVVCVGILLDILSGNRARSKSIVNGKNMILIGIVFWILLDGLTMKEGLENFSPQAVFNVYAMILVFLLSASISHLSSWPKWSQRVFRSIDYGEDIDPKKLRWFILACFLIGFLPVILWGGGFEKVVWTFTHAGRWNAQWGRSRWGDSLDYVKTLLGYFLILSLQLSWFYMVCMKKWFSPLVFFSSFFALWMVFITGTRNYFVGALAPLILLYYFSAKDRGKNKFWVLLLAGFLTLSLAQLQFEVRNAESDQTLWFVARKSLMSILKKDPREHHRDDQLQQLFNYAQLVPNEIPHSGEPVILRPLYHFIPRAIWKNKPEGITRFFEEQTNEGSGFTTFAGSIIGDFYLCQGWLGVILAGTLMGFLAKQLEYLSEKIQQSPAILFIYSYGLMFLFTSIRSYQIIYEGWFIFVLFYFVFQKIRSGRTSLEVA